MRQMSAHASRGINRTIWFHHYPRGRPENRESRPGPAFGSVTRTAERERRFDARNPDDTSTAYLSTDMRLGIGLTGIVILRCAAALHWTNMASSSTASLVY